MLCHVGHDISNDVFLCVCVEVPVYGEFFRRTIFTIVDLVVFICIHPISTEYLQEYSCAFSIFAMCNRNDIKIYPWEKGPKYWFIGKATVQRLATFSRSVDLHNL